MDTEKYNAEAAQAWATAGNKSRAEALVRRIQIDHIRNRALSALRGSNKSRTPPEVTSRRPEIANKRILIAGFFSAKENAEARMAELAKAVEDQGGIVVGRVVQRRGVSRGGVKVMSRPLSARTLFSAGKTEELVQACRTFRVDALVLWNQPTDRQRSNLSSLAGLPVGSMADLEAHPS